MGLLIKLQNGDTALKSLKFGKDRPGGGDSGQPYIQDPILDNPLPNSPDFLLRGGLNAPIDAAQDVVRLTKYMFNPKSPSGLLFTAKQNLLSRVAPKTEAAKLKGAAYAGGALNEGVYTPLSTLAQAGVGFAGIHLNKQGIDPTGLIPGLSIRDYEKVAYNNNQGGNNRLVNYFTEKQITNSQSTNLDTYQGGPGSILGIGKTSILFATDGNGATLRTGVNNTLAKSKPKSFYEGGPVRPKSSGPDQDRVDYNNLLGASKKEGLTESETGVSSNGTFSTLYNPDITYSTLSKNNPTGGKSLSGSGGYQIGPRRPLEVNLQNYLGASKFQSIPNDKLFPEYITYGSGSNVTLGKSNLITNLSGSDGYQSSRLTAIQSHYPSQSSYPVYVSPIETELEKINRELTSQPKFDPGTFTFEPTRSGSIISIPKYSSGPSLKIDPKADEKGVTLNDDVIAERLNTSETNSNNEGYLANLNKNGGVNSEGNASFHNPYRVGGRGISNDFRQVNRRKRGFIDPASTYDHIAPEEGQFVDYRIETTVDKIYYVSGPEGEKRLSKPLNPSGDYASLDGVDLIPFRFEIINPTNPTKSSEILTFRAYIDNFSDTYSPEWKSQTYMGRAEKFYKYDSFDRSISLGFTIVADNKFNLNTMYTQLNTLAASLAPTYTTQGYMAGNLHKLTVGNYIYNQVGIMNGFTYDVIDESPWDIDKNLPFYIKVTGIKFTPIHNFRPETLWGKNQHEFINQTSSPPPKKDTPTNRVGDSPVDQIFNPRTQLQEVTVRPNRN